MFDDTNCVKVLPTSATTSTSMDLNSKVGMLVVKFFWYFLRQATMKQVNTTIGEGDI